MIVHHKAWQRLLHSLGLSLSLEEVRETIHGVNEEILVRLFGGRFTAEERTKLANKKEAEYRTIFTDHLELIAGLNHYLDLLNQNGIPMAIGSAAPVENVDFVLDKLNLRAYFKTALHAGDVIKGKPDPEIYLKAADRMGVPIEDCLVFEDSPTGAAAANGAGSPIIIITTTHQEREFYQFSNVIAFIEDYTSADLMHLTSKLFGVPFS